MLGRFFYENFFYMPFLAEILESPKKLNYGFENKH